MKNVHQPQRFHFLLQAGQLHFLLPQNLVNILHKISAPANCSEYAAFPHFSRVLTVVKALKHWEFYLSCSGKMSCNLRNALPRAPFARYSQARNRGKNRNIFHPDRFIMNPASLCASLPKTFLRPAPNSVTALCRGCTCLKTNHINSPSFH